MSQDLREVQRREAKCDNIRERWGRRAGGRKFGRRLKRQKPDEERGEEGGACFSYVQCRHIGTSIISLYLQECTGLYNKVLKRAALMTEPATFQIADINVSALREAVSKIAHTGYSETGVRERLGLQDLADLNWRALPIYREERLAARDPLDQAIDLFLLQGALAANELDGWLAASDREILSRSGLLVVDETGLARARA